MPTYTSNLGLVKPSNTETVSIEVLNANWDKIDEILSGMMYVDEYKTTTETINGKTVNWFIRKYNDGRMEIESDPVQYQLRAEHRWDGGVGPFMFTTRQAMQFVFPYTFTKIHTWECKAVESTELCLEVPILAGTEGSVFDSKLTMSGWKVWPLYVDVWPQTFSIKIKIRISGHWK